jgi:hypothetical protein
VADFGRTLTAASGGLGRLAQAIGGGGGAGGSYERARQDEMLLQSRLAQALSTIDANRAKAAQDEQETRTMSGRGDVGDELMAAEAGTTLPVLKAWRNQVRGTPQGSATGYPEIDEAIGIKADAPVDSKIAMELAKRAPRYAVYRTNTKDMKPDDLAQARKLDREGDLSDGIIAGTMDRNRVGGAQAAVKGDALFSSDSTGSVLDKYTGSLDTSNPMAGSTIRLRTEQAGQAKAGAAENYAQAGAANALTDQRRQVTAAGGGGGKAPAHYRYVKDADGELRLEPIPGGKADPSNQRGKPLPPAASKGYLENIQNLDRAQKALDLIDGKNIGAANGDTAATGLKGYLPNQLLNRIDPAGVDTRAAIADLGSLVIHDRSGAAVTAAEFPRLAPFIPTEKDEPETAKKKLKLFVQNYKAVVDDATDFYSQSGYNVPTLQRRRAQAAPAGKPGAAAPAAGGGFTYLGKE